MDNDERAPRWLHPWRSEPVPPAEDPADMGTAFGLDLSLMEQAPLPEAPSGRDTGFGYPGWRRR